MGRLSTDADVAANTPSTDLTRSGRRKIGRGARRAAAAGHRVPGGAVPGVQTPDRFESLEHRLHFSVSTNANGWTVVTPDANSRVIYVSTSGSDSNSGLSPSAPVATLAKATSLVRSGDPDEILLQSGDVWHGQSFSDWTASGEDANDPIVVSYYGTGALPVVDPGNYYAGFTVYGQYGSDAGNVSFLDIIGINFYCQNRDPNSSTYNGDQGGGVSGFQDWTPGQDVRLEDDQFSYFHNNIDIEAINGPQTDMTVYRCVSDYSWSATSHSQGLYSNMTDSLSIIQSTFDHNGWNDLIPGAEQQGYNHDIYCSYDTTNVTIQGCILAEASFAGIMARSGGNIDNNAFIDDTIAVSYGDATGAHSTPGGVSGSLVGNVIVGDHALNGLEYGQGFDIGNTKSLVVSNNIFTDDTQLAKPAIDLDYASGTDNPQDAVGLNNTTITNNIIYGWWLGIETAGYLELGGTGIYSENNVSITDNQIVNATEQEFRHISAPDPAYETIADNEYYDTNLPQSKWQSLEGNVVSMTQWEAGVEPTAIIMPYLPYAAPNRTVDTYDGTLGGTGTFEDFMATADQLTINNYNPQYMAAAVITYIEGGFSTNITAPTATAAVPNVGAPAIGTGIYTFTVTYTDGFGMNSSTYDSDNLLVTGPNGYTTPATFVSAAGQTTANGYASTVVTYDIAAPNGAWAKGEDGTYSVSMLPNQVLDSSGLAVAAGVLATFAADFTPPTAVATVTPMTSVPTGGYTFTITYSDASGVDPTTLDSSEIHATGPNGYSEYATLDSVNTGTTTSAGQTLVATYTLYGPGGTWTNAMSGTYTLANAGGEIADIFGNTLAAGTLATFAVSVGGNGTVAASPVGVISGTVFLDSNGDGVQDNRELGMAGVTVFVDLAGTGLYTAADPVAVTNSTGGYSITGLAAGTYTVIEQTPSGYTASNQTVTIPASQAGVTANFADTLGTAVVNGANTSTGKTTSNASTGATTSNTSTGTTASNTSTGTTINGSKTGTITTTTGPTKVTIGKTIAVQPAPVPVIQNQIQTGLAASVGLTQQKKPSVKP
jgi:hypothetical protein